MTHAGPLTPIGKRSTMTLTGLWRAVVERLDPLAVSVPALAGQGSVIGKVEAVPGLTLTEGARVWVACIEGDTRDLLIVAVRG